MADTGKIIGLIEALGGGGGGSGGGVSATVIADAFSTSKAYSAGEYVTRNDKLYVFTADHAAGAWIGTDADEVTVGEELSDVKSAIAHKGSITLSATWSGSDPYTQTVTVSGLTVSANDRIDLQPTAAQLAQLISDGVQALYVENNNGTLTAYAVGGSTSAAMTIQCTVSGVIA